MAAAKRGKKLPKARRRKRIDNELKQFAIVQEDDKNEFALRLETLALKKSTSIKVFEQVKTELYAGLNVEKVKEESSQERQAKTTRYVHSQAQGEV